MTAYRDDAPRSTDLETASIHDLLARTKRLRKRVALPAIAISMILAWLGATAHVMGRWSILGALPDGSYYVNGATMALAAVIAAAPAMAIGAPLYFALRAKMRAAWLEEYRKKPVCDAWPDRDEWLERTSRRFG